MKLSCRLICFLSISLFFFNCSGNIEIKPEAKESATFVTTQFSDNGKTIDSIVKAYNCEGVEYNNWTENDATDSCLTVCLINSTKVPSSGNINNPVFTAMATAIKKSLAKPQDYNSYYIIFVNKDSVNGAEIKVHSAGMQIQNSEL